MLRITAVALLIWVVWRVLCPAQPRVAEQVDARALHGALTRWSTRAPPRRVHVTLAPGSVLPGFQRQWLVALRRNGVRTTWGQPIGTPIGAPLLATAIDLEPVADPRGGTRVNVAAPAGSQVTVQDALGLIGSVRVAPGSQGATLLAPGVVRSADGVVNGTPARGAGVDSLVLRRLFILASASWEAKYVVRALEEEGWQVDLHIALAPKGDVVQGRVADIDTARYAAVLAVDTTAAAEASRIAAYVRKGGGLVVMGSAVRSFRGVAPGNAGVRIRDGNDTPSDSAPRQSLGLVPVTQLASEAVVIERRGSQVAVAARRAGQGRVIQVGYDDTWRWRMAGGDSAVPRHRAWWASVVSAVAYAPRIERSPFAGADAAPLAHLVDALGLPVASDPTQASTRPPFDPTRSVWVFTVLLLALAAEWVLRRMRGAR
ncbi:MAG TPA: hypothetical protein VNW46_02435 [Gemmatimonadaceae bacterium]|nr:hypothetical protein [Gemmatimonadaceae bacterium]